MHKTDRLLAIARLMVLFGIAMLFATLVSSLTYR